MLVGPNVLRNSNNVMHVASRGETEFVIDNVVLLYKVREWADSRTCLAPSSLGKKRRSRRM